MTLTNAIEYSPKTTLAAALAPGATQVEVTDITAFPEAPFYVVLTVSGNADFNHEDLSLYETALVAEVDIPNSLLKQITRQVEGTGELGQGGDWAIGANIAAFWTAAAYTDFKDLVEANSNKVLPASGTTGQVLAKASATDYDTEWADVDLSNIQESLRWGAL